MAIEITTHKNGSRSKSMKKQRLFIKAEEIDEKNSRAMRRIKIPYWYPSNEFPDSPVITHKFIADVGGDGFQFLWTRRNLYILARIFDEILKENNPNIRMQLIFGFIQSLHLTSKMVVPRHEAAQRDFSGSWGRADYMIRRRQMEQNPLMVFRRSCINKQGVISSLRDAENSLPANIKTNDYNKTKQIRKTADLTYGIMDVADITRCIQDKSIDFIITDPPYAGLV